MSSCLHARQERYVSSRQKFIEAEEEEAQLYWYSQMLDQVDDTFSWDWVKDPVPAKVKDDSFTFMTGLFMSISLVAGIATLIFLITSGAM